MPGPLIPVMVAAVGFVGAVTPPKRRRKKKRGAVGKRSSGVGRRGSTVPVVGSGRRNAKGKAPTTKRDPVPRIPPSRVALATKLSMDAGMRRWTNAIAERPGRIRELAQGLGGDVETVSRAIASEVFPHLTWPPAPSATGQAKVWNQIVADVTKTLRG